jgi:hypothetical protein
MEPNEQWTLPELAEYISGVARRSAEDAWRIGTALLIVRRRHRRDRDFTKWVRANVGFHRATVYRYMGIAERVSLDDCRVMTLTELYALVEGRRERRLSQAATKLSWAVEESDPLADRIDEISAALAEWLDGGVAVADRDAVARKLAELERLLVRVRAELDGVEAA